jgi:hypothetical protein
MVRVNEPLTLAACDGSWKGRDDIPRLGICFSGKESLGDLFRAGMQYYVSDRFKAVLEEECRGDVEIYPFLIEDETGLTISDCFYLMNIIGVEDCLDLKAMEAEMWTPPGTSEQRIRKRRAILMRAGFQTSRKIWRPRYMETHRVVERSLRCALEAAHIRAVEYQEFRVASNPDPVIGNAKLASSQ